jgi:hypothetical protein
MGEEGLRHLLHESNLAGPVIRSSGGVKYALVNGNMVILLPTSTTEQECENVVSGLSKIIDETPKDANWLIDCSFLQSFSFLVLGTMLAIEGRLRFRNKQMQLCWLKPSLLPRHLSERLSTVFNLHTVGGYLFSRDIKR